MKKVLVITSVASMVDQFLLPNIRLLQDMDYEVHVACNFEKGSTCSDERIAELKKRLNEWNVTYYQIDFARDVTKIPKIVLAYKQVVKIINDNNYDLVHCHSPIGGLITRLACRKVRKSGTKVLYTAHGFHFYKGAPKKNWLIYYPIERFCALFTDVLITMNQEDFDLAQKKMKAKKVVYVPGVGIDLDKFGTKEVDKKAKRQELGIPLDAKWLLNIGELIPRKNQETLIRAISEIEGVCLTIAGRGELKEQLSSLINDLGVSDRVKLLGFRTDISELCNACDAFAFSSFHEGLPVSVMEAMASSLPVVCSRIRGNTDLIDENGGVMFDPHSAEDCKVAIEEMLSKDLKALGDYNAEKIKNFEVGNVIEIMTDMYKNIN